MATTTSQVLNDSSWKGNTAKDALTNSLAGVCAPVTQYGADPTGVADSAAAFAAAAAAFDTPYVPAGTYTLSTITQAIYAGFWGPGDVYVNGVLMPLPRRPGERWWELTTRGSFMQSLQSRSPLVFIGDSVTAHYDASVIGNSWVQQIQKFINIRYAPLSQPSIADFNDNSSGNASFYGLTYTGSVSFGTTGPVGTSLILASGASISLTVNAAYVDVFYDQVAGGGSLQFAFNGGAAYKTVSTAGTSKDQCTFPSATGHSVSGTYTLTASGGPVTITNLMVLGSEVSAAPQAFVFRFAKGSQPSATFANAAVLTSIVNQAMTAAISGGSTPPTFIVGLGFNDMINPAVYATPTQYKANMVLIFTTLKRLSGGQVIAWAPWRPSGAWSINPGYLWEQYVAALLAAAQLCDVPMIRTDQIDFNQEGLTQDGLHPTNAGEIRLVRAVLDVLERSEALNARQQMVMFNAGFSPTYFGSSQDRAVLQQNMDLNGTVIDTTKGVAAIYPTVSTGGSKIDLYTGSSVGIDPPVAATLDAHANFALQIAGSGLRVKEGSNAKQGFATLAAGSAVVANTSVTANSRIFLTSQVDGGTPGWVRVSTRTAGTSFTITSSSNLDTSTVAYEIFEPS